MEQRYLARSYRDNQSALMFGLINWKGRNLPIKPLPPTIEQSDHVLGDPGAAIALVEYGSYACPHCRAAHARIIDLRDEFGDRLVHAFRHRPLNGNRLAVEAAELAERAGARGQFWKAHAALMTRSEQLTSDDLEQIAQDLGIPGPDTGEGRKAARKVQKDAKSAAANGAHLTPTFFINGRRYDGPWDDVSFADAMLGALGYRVRSAALDFVNWPPSSGILLFLATLLALLVSNSVYAAGFESLWQQEFGFFWSSGDFAMSALRWVNDGLLTIFFLLVGLEIKREFTVGHLAKRQYAALPVAASFGGMIVPAALYLIAIPSGLAQGWGIPIGTDTAFCVALIAMMGQRVPIELRIFLTAAAIVDDIGAILIVALFYSKGLDPTFLLAAAAVVAILAALNRAAIYRLTPYLLLGLILWLFIFLGGVHATLAGVLLALFIPTRPPPDYSALVSQTDAIVAAEISQGTDMRHSFSTGAMRAIDAIYDRMESPAARLLRIVEIRSSYVVLPIFAFANAGVTLTPGLFDGRSELAAAIILGLVAGKPLGLLSFSYLAVASRVAAKPSAFGWRHVFGAGCLAGIGFTMSLFIAGQSFADPADYAAAKVSIFIASALAAGLGIAVLWRAGNPSVDSA